MANKDELRAKYSEVTGQEPDPTWTGKVLVDKIKDAKKASKGKKPKKVSTSSASKETSEPSIQEVLGAVNALTDTVNKVAKIAVDTADKVSAIENGTTTPTKPADDSDDKYTPETDETINQTFVPKKFRDLVDTILSPEFGVDIQDQEDGMDFMFTLIVPDKYSSISAEDRAKGKKDLRSRMIQRAKGENGVREWCTLVRDNLNKFYTQSGTQSPFTNSKEQ